MPCADPGSRLLAPLSASPTLAASDIERTGVRHRLSAQTGVADPADPLAGVASAGGEVPGGCVRAGGGYLLLLGGPLVAVPGGSADPWSCGVLGALCQSTATGEFCLLSRIDTQLPVGVAGPAWRDRVPVTLAAIYQRFERD
ncbi:hypothetical protein D3C73_1144520 [compost metagenome]